MIIITDGKEQALEVATRLAALGYLRDGWFNAQPFEETLYIIRNYFDAEGMAGLKFKTTGFKRYQLTNDSVSSGMGFPEFMDAVAYNEY